MELTEIQSFIRENTKGFINWGDLSSQLRTSFFTFEIRVLIILLIIFLLLLINGYTYYQRKTSTDEDSKNDSDGKKRVIISRNNWLWRHKLLIINSILGVILIFLIAITFIIRPEVVYTSPTEGGYMNSGAQTIELQFDMPVDEETIQFNISPEVEGEWKIEPAIEISPLARRATFYPKESIFPGNEVVVYVVGIRQWYGVGKLHEQAIEFKSPRIPEVAELSMPDDAENVNTDTDIVLTYDAPVGDFVEIGIQATPDVEYQLVDEGRQAQRIDFTSKLEQDQEYQIEIFRTPKSFNVESGEDLELGDTETIKTISFKTVTTPFIESFTPKGESVLINTPIGIIFDQDMDRESVESNFSITPVVPGKFEWVDDKNMKFLPEKELDRDTRYEVKLAVGVASSAAGIIEEELLVDFKTIGAVKASITNPANGTSGHNPNVTNIVVQFDQEVDKESAESSLAVTPYVAGSYSWEGNNMTYVTSKQLSYSTRYNISIKPGVKSIHGLDSTETFSSYFVTKDNAFILTIPWYKQQEGFTCNIAATRMVLAYHGINVTESTVKNSVGIGTDPNSNWVPGYGVHVGPIANYIGQYRPVTIKTGWNVPEMMKEVEKGNLVILWWYNRYSQPPGAFTLGSGATAYTGMHSEIVRGFIGDPKNPTHIMTNDPWRGRLTYNRALFDATWSYLGNTALVVE